MRKLMNKSKIVDCLIENKFPGVAKAFNKQHWNDSFVDEEEVEELFNNLNLSFRRMQEDVPTYIPDENITDVYKHVTDTSTINEDIAYFIRLKEFEIEQLKKQLAKEEKDRDVIWNFTCAKTHMKLTQSKKNNNL